MQASINQAKSFLEKGELVAIPTETVYGLAANAYQAEAVVKIFQAKNRPAFDPLIVHTHHVDQIQDFSHLLSNEAKILAQSFWPGPLTLVLPKKAIIPDIVTSGLDTVGVRIPNHPLTLSLLRNLDFPLAAPSANPFGYISPTSAAHVRAQMGNKVTYILDGGPAQVGIESTIVGFPNGKPTVLRLGGIALETIENHIGKVAFNTHSSSNPQAPGMLTSHYAPRKPFYLLNKQRLLPWLRRFPAKKIGMLSFRYPFPEIPLKNQISLSESGNLAEAAQRLFLAMRYLDTLPVDIILAELLPEEGLGRAINDRIRRATSAAS